jgi:uncharacterized membrane protein
MSNGLQWQGLVFLVMALIGTAVTVSLPFWVVYRVVKRLMKRGRT